MKIKKKILASRDQAKYILALAKTRNEKVIDFLEVEFINHSFANEFIKLNEEEKTEIKNMNDRVKTMFEIARSNLESKDKENELKRNPIPLFL